MFALLLAYVAHEINRAYCAAMGDFTPLAWADAPEWQKQSALAGANMHLANPNTTPEQSHAAWMAHKLAEGWTYAPEKNTELKQHPCMRPYEELPPEQKVKDHLFRAAVHAANEAIKQARATPATSAKTSVRADWMVVRYIGRRPEWVDDLYQSGLSFVTGQVRTVPPELARQLLRHGDVFALVAAEVEEVAPTAPDADDQRESANDEPKDEPKDQPEDDTAALLEQSAKQDADRRAEQTVLQDMLDQVNGMNKVALTEFAKTNYRQELNQRSTVPVLREQVLSFVHQFGAP